VTKDLKTEAECRIVYLDILNGYTESPEAKAFIKHNTEIDNCIIEVNRARYFDEAGKKGLLSEKDKLALLAEHDHWSLKEEENYQQQICDLDSMRFSLKKLIIPQQVEHMSGTIKEKEKSIYPIIIERSQLLGATKEHYANNRAQEEHLLKSFYKDTSLKTPLFSEEEGDELQASQITF